MKKLFQSDCPAERCHVLMKAAIVLIALCGTAICVLWFPYASYVGMPDVKEMGEQAFRAMYASQLSLLLLSALPCYAIVFFLWKVSDLVAAGRLFTLGAVRYFKLSAVVLFCDIFFFLAVNLTFFCLGANDWLWLYIFIDLCALCVALFFYIVSRCLNEGAKLQEESDGTI